jgi:hypothetical protein
VQWPAGLNPLHNPGAERSPPPTPVGRAAAINRPTVARKNDTRQHGTPHHHAPEPRAGGSIKRDDPGASCQRDCLLAVSPPAPFRAACPVRKPAEATHPPSATTTFRRRDRQSGSTYRCRDCTVVAVLHVWQRRPVAAQAIRPITGAGLVTHLEAFWVRDENQA